MIGDVAVDIHGNIYSSEGTDALVKRNATGQVMALWHNFSAVGSLAVNAQGIIYGTDQNGNQVFKISPTGKVLAVWK